MEEKKKAEKARSKIVNDITKYSQIVLKKDPNFDIIKSYQNSPFNDDKIRIPTSTLDHTLGEKWFNNEEVIRIMTDVKNSIYKKKVKVYSETFNKYKWMEVNDIEYCYRKLIPAAFMYLTVVKANSASRNMDDLIIELYLNKNSMFTDEAQIAEEYEYGYSMYSTIFTRLNLLIDSTESLIKENYHILDDPDKPIQDKLNEIMDRFVDEDENYDAYESKLWEENSHYLEYAFEQG